MAQIGHLAIANTSTYIQGSLDTWLTDNGDSKTLDIYLYFRRTNSYSGTTYSSNVSCTLKIGSQETTGSFAPSIPAYDNGWKGWYLHASRTFTGDARDVTISWSTSDHITSFFGGSGSANVSIPASYTNPAQPTVTLKSKTYNSATFGVSLSSYGNPASASGRYIEAAVLAQNSYGNSYRYTTASNVTSATLTVNNSSSTGSPALTIQGNKQYWYGGYATNTQRSNSIVTGSFYTPCPPPSALSVSSQTYTAYNKVSAVMSYTRQSDGGAQTRTGYYRYSTDGGSSYTSWTSFGTVSNTTGTFTINNLPTSKSITVQIKLNTSSGGDSATKSVTFTSSTTHTAPNFSNFTYEDTNTAAVHITGNNQTMIQSISDPKITISTANKATGNDGIAVSNYSFSFSGRSDTAAWSSSSAVTKTLGKPTTSGTQTMTVSAVDALSLSKAVNKSVTVYPWSAPTITATATRLNNFENDTTIHIVGTWSPVTISGVNKNTMEVKYRYKQSTTTTWGSWITLTASHNTANWTTQDFVLNLDNNYSWNLEAYVGDYFTSKITSITIPAGQPQFFIGADGRCAVGGKPTKAKVSGKKGQLEMHGQIYIPNASGDKTDCGLVLENSVAGTDTMAWFRRSDTGGAIGVGVGTGGTNHGLWSEKQNKWMIYGDNSDIHIGNSSGNIYIGDKLFKVGNFTLVTSKTSTAGETSNNVTLPAQGLYMVVWYQGGSWPTQVILHCATGWQSTSVKIMGSDTKVSCRNAYSSQTLTNPILSLTNTTNAGATWYIYRII